MSRQAAMKQVFKPPKSLKDVTSHFCPGCHHGIIHRLTAEQLDAFGLQGRTIGVASVGCSVFLYDYFDVDVVRRPTAWPRPWPRASSAPGRTRSCSPIRATATWRP
jgi:hypothetical protein